MRPYPLMPGRSQFGAGSSIYQPYYTLHGGLGRLGEAPYDLRMYHNEGLDGLGASAPYDFRIHDGGPYFGAVGDPGAPADANTKWYFGAGGAALGLLGGWLLFKR